jgi:glutamyl-tRNA synthetase
MSPLNRADDADLAKLLMMKKGFRLLRDVDDATRFFYVPSNEIAFDPAAVEMLLINNDGEGLQVLRDLREILTNTREWAASALEAAVKDYCEAKGLGLGKVAQPLRVAISGTTVSPPIFETLEFLGRDRTMTRVERCLAVTAAV